MALASTDIKVEGLDEVLRTTKKTFDKMRQDLRRGLIKSGLAIKAQSVRNAPIDTSNLRASGFIWYTGQAVPAPMFKMQGRSGSKADIAKLNASHAAQMAEAQQEIKSDFEIMVGHSAHYALPVHEGDEGANWNSGGPKYLEKSVAQNRAFIMHIILAEAKVD
jgi:hypothetical protein